MITGLDLLRYGCGRVTNVERVALLCDQAFGVMSFLDAEPWLRQMTFFDDARASDWPEDFVSKGHRYAFQAWTPERIWFSSSRDGVAILDWRPVDGDEWMRSMSAFEPELIEISSGRLWKFGRPE